MSDTTQILNQLRAAQKHHEAEARRIGKAIDALAPEKPVQKTRAKRSVKSEAPTDGDGQ